MAQVIISIATDQSRLALVVLGRRTSTGSALRILLTWVLRIACIFIHTGRQKKFAAEFWMDLPDERPLTKVQSAALVRVRFEAKCLHMAKGIPRTVDKVDDKIIFANMNWLEPAGVELDGDNTHCDLDEFS